MTYGAEFRKGTLLVICAPSGTGKSTLVNMLMDEFPDFGFSVSYTTRDPRGKEQNGVEYHFINHETFQEMIGQGQFAEWAEVHGNFYGTAKAPIQEMLNSGKNVLFDIDVQGAMQLRKTFTEAVLVFLLPPSREELERRLVGRATDSSEAVAKRMINAVRELKLAPRFDYWVINDNLELAYQELKSVFMASRCKPALRPGLLDDVMQSWDE